MNRNKLFAVALEDQDPLNADGGEVSPIEIAEDAAELEQAGNVVDAGDQQMKDAQAAVSALECLCQAFNSGGSTSISPEAAAATEVALEGIYERLGVQRPKVFAFEDGESGPSRVQKIKEQILRFLRAIAEAFRKALDVVHDFILKATAAAARLEKYAYKQLQEVRKMRGMEMKETEFKNSSLAAKLYCPDADLSKALLRVQELTNDASKVALGEHVQALNKTIDAFVEGKDISKLIADIPDVLNSAYNGIFAHNGESSPVDPEDQFKHEGTQFYTSDYLVGGYVALLIMPETIDALKYLSFRIRQPEFDDIGDTLKYSTPEQMEGLLKQVISICGVVRLFEREERKLQDFGGKLTAASKKLTSVEGEFSEQDRLFLKNLAVMAPTIASGIHQRVFGYAVNASRSVVHYVDLCMKNMQPKAEAA